MALDDPAMKNRTTLAAALILGVLSVVALRPSIRGVDGVGNYVYLIGTSKN